MTRTFGIELELVGKRGQQVGLWGRVLQALQAAGMDPAQSTYAGSDYSRWQVKPDGSVSCGGYPGCEVVSPVLPADATGWAQVQTVCDALEVAHATANKTCGMHVHVDIRDLSVEQVKNVVRAYGHFQAEIDSVLPASRRNSRWAAPVWNNWTRSTMLARIEQARTVQDLAYAIGTRYSVMNLQKYVRTGTLEFRQHSGTSEAKKALAWAKWCVAFVEAYKDVNVLVQPAAAAAAETTVTLDLPGRGERRNPARGISRNLVRAMAGGPTREVDLEDVLRDSGNDETVEAWMRPLASRYGVSVQRVSLNGVTCWQLASHGAAPAQPATPFVACFTPGGHLAHFGARRAALA